MIIQNGITKKSLEIAAVCIFQSIYTCNSVKSTAGKPAELQVQTINCRTC